VSKDYYCEECRSYEQKLEQCDYQIRELFGPLIRNYAAATANEVFAVRGKERELGRSRIAITSAYSKHVRDTHAKK
jgi:hypothetical protein